ncbi:hypothetical protein PHET_11532 [Paragonimus heterotremus]|uniref:Uncharacterized protein n=1 Tax=Paragonimus heterotremus TaxID=100268 RepID=A0A8J4WDQ8_9TREM|nr:hypothetical protein PHET_11532 [Paragonimus heterotremus]
MTSRDAHNLNPLIDKNFRPHDDNTKILLAQKARVHLTHKYVILFTSFVIIQKFHIRQTATTSHLLAETGI